MQISSEAGRRWVAMFCLSVAAGMLTWGEFLLTPWLHRSVSVLYWSICAVLACGAVGLAVVDIRKARRELRQHHDQLVRETFEKIKRGELPED